MVRLTGAKAASNTSLRWVPFFLVALGDAFGASTATMAAIVGFGEMAGLSTLLIRRRLDAGQERSVLIAALVLSTFAGVVALAGHIVLFALAFVMLMIANAHVTVAGHAWISARVGYERRARFIGLFETSWAAGLLVGAPLMAVLITNVGWRGPFVAVIVLGGLALVGIVTMPKVPTPSNNAPVEAASGGPVVPVTTALNFDAWLAIGASALVAMGGLTTIVVVGTWLSDDLGVSTGGIGGVAMAFGAVELVSVGASAGFADRLGKRASMLGAVAAVLAGLAVIAVAGTSLGLAAFGLLIFFFGFEYAIVTSFSLVSEAMPAARGRAIATNSAIGTAVRGGGAVAAGLLFVQFGIRGPVVLSALALVGSAACLAALGRR